MRALVVVTSVAHTWETPLYCVDPNSLCPITTDNRPSEERGSLRLASSRGADRDPHPGLTLAFTLQAVVGDCEYLHFKHRMSPANVRVVEVGGDVQLHSVNVF